MADRRRAFVTLAAWLAEDDAASGWGHADGAVDWPEVIALANDFLVVAALLPTLARRGLLDGAPAGVRRYLSDVHRANGARNGILRRQTLEAAAALNRRGIVPAVLKGGRWLVADPQRTAERIMADIDLLVPADDLARGGEALEALGYRPVPEDASMPAHAVTLARPGALATIDLHHTPGPLAGIISGTEVLAGAAPAEAEAAVLVPRPTHQALVGLIGSEIVGPNYHLGVLALRPLHDLSVCGGPRGAAIDWGAIRARLEPWGLAHRADAWACAAAALFGLEVPGKMRGRPRARLHLARCLAQLRRPRLAAAARWRNSLAHPFEPTCLAWLYPAGRFPRPVRHAWRIVRRHGFGLVAKLGAQGHMP
jgi:hypothetical protein